MPLLRNFSKACHIYLFIMEDMFQEDDLLDFNIMPAFDQLQQQNLPCLLKNNASCQPPLNRTTVSGVNSFTEPNRNNKNKYINKINSMVKQVKLQNILQKDLGLVKSSRKNSYGQFSANLSLKEEAESQSVSHRFSEKLQRNRISAKHSRERKKLYMDLLQKQIENLQSQKTQLDGEIQSNKIQISKIVDQNQSMSGLTVGKQSFVKKLQRLVLNKSESDYEEINTILDSLSLRIGATGKLRINALNQYFKQAFNLMFPTMQAYLLWAASERRHIFNETEQDQYQIIQQYFRWFGMDKIDLSPEQKQQILESRNFFNEHKQKFFEFKKNLNDLKVTVMHKEQELEMEIDLLRNVFTPLQCARIVLFIEQNKYREEISLMSVLGLDQVKKKIKIQL